jgi:hypothetical protein
MNALNRSTHRRLQKLPQAPSVWEGDRCCLSPSIKIKDDLDASPKDCILWVDGNEAVVRSLEMVPGETGYEATVRALVRAMESPNPPSSPARPKKILVRDRELQFYLRGVLQDLNISIEYSSDLPLIDDLRQGLQNFLGNGSTVTLPAGYGVFLLQAAYEIWADSPWTNLDDAKIFSVRLNYEDVDTLYVSLLGMLGEEYGVLLYRSLDSLKAFRQKVLEGGASPAVMEEAFLEQDCFFLTYEPVDETEPFVAESEDESEALDALQAQFQEEAGMLPSFGTLHPLEGMRQVLYPEEAAVLCVALAGLHRFFQRNLDQLDMDLFPRKTGRYRVPDPAHPDQMIQVQVSTLPELSAELYEMMPEDEDEEAILEDFDALREFLASAGFPVPPTLPVLRDDLIPTDSFFSLGSIPWEVLEILRQSAQYLQPAEDSFPKKADGFPIILIQTSRPKAIKLIETIQAAGGLKAIAFNPGEDNYSGMVYDLGILQTQNSEMHLFGEFDSQDPVHIQARKKWDQRCKKTKGHCGLIVARGVTGAARGNPGLDDMMGLFEVRSLTGKDLGLTALKLVPRF